MTECRKYCGLSSQARTAGWYTIFQNASPILPPRSRKVQGSVRIYGIKVYSVETKTPGRKAGRIRELIGYEAGQTLDCATTTLRQGLSTSSASSEARMLAPAARMNTLSQWPEVCCT